MITPYLALASRIFRDADLILSLISYQYPAVERREAERAAKTQIPEAFSLPDVGKSFANFQQGSAREGLVAAPLSPLSTLGGCVDFRDNRGPFFDQTEKSPGCRRCRGGRSSIGKQISRYPRLFVLAHRREFSRLFYCPTLCQPSPFPATAETKKERKHKNTTNETGVKRLRRGRWRREGRRRQRCCVFTVFCVFMKAECSNEGKGEKKKTLFSRTC